MRSRGDNEGMLDLELDNLGRLLPLLWRQLWRKAGGQRRRDGGRWRKAGGQRRRDVAEVDRHDDGEGRTMRLRSDNKGMLDLDIDNLGRLLLSLGQLLRRKAGGQRHGESGE